ncbi:hypothetical protein SSABA_v1c08110 [Spiroplasma sabaudiense Ar-1343]|uniref:Transmembrane protein n=1 Tax=Spiroplasma sabaudiense Ar-1343 TaxID=1276257 RepID=W6ABK9_9MOLU|nr:hypothetical protein [Spiroplasma sabaudiense]AHI54210.1 hypothetical protein SSABA_v1c08110 [Spiroplasma sabaudiense Ar-1343]
MFKRLAIAAWIIVFIGALSLIAGAIIIMYAESLSNGTLLAKISDILTKQWLGVKALGIDSMVPTTYKYFYVALPVAYITFAGILVILSIVEFVRIKRRQKISLPFVKIYMIFIIIFALIFGQLVVLPLAGCLFIALILLEIILHDVDALNNYSEERNLILIYREEKKFEKEVNKEGRRSWKIRFGSWDEKLEKPNSKYKKSYKKDQGKW